MMPGYIIFSIGDYKGIIYHVIVGEQPLTRNHMASNIQMAAATYHHIYEAQC